MNEERLRALQVRTSFGGKRLQCTTANGVWSSNLCHAAWIVTGLTFDKFVQRCDGATSSINHELRILFPRIEWIGKNKEIKMKSTILKCDFIAPDTQTKSRRTENDSSIEAVQRVCMRMRERYAAFLWKCHWIMFCFRVYTQRFCLRFWVWVTALFHIFLMRSNFIQQTLKRSHWNIHSFALPYVVHSSLRLFVSFRSVSLENTFLFHNLEWICAVYVIILSWSVA